MTQNIGSDGQSFKGYAGLTEESSYGGGGAPSAFLPIISDGFGPENELLFNNSVRTRGRQPAAAGAFADDGSVELVAGPENGLGYLLKGAFGTASVTASDPDGDATNEVGTHTFSVADKLPSWAVEIGLGSIDAARHLGVGVDTIEFSHTPEEYLTISTDLTASRFELQGAQASPTYSDLLPFTWHTGTITVDGSDRTVDVSEVSIELANNLETKIRGNRYADKMDVGTREVSGSLALDFENNDMAQKFLGGSTATTVQDTLYKASLNCQWVSPETIADVNTNYELRVDLPQISLGTHEAQLNEDDAIVENIDWEAEIDPSAGYEIEATLVNGQTSAY